MPTLAELQEQLDALRAARWTGTLVIRTADGRSVTYKSDKEMAAAIGDLVDQINATAGTPTLTFVRVGHASGVK